MKKGAFPFPEGRREEISEGRKMTPFLSQKWKMSSEIDMNLGEERLQRPLPGPMQRYGTKNLEKRKDTGSISKPRGAAAAKRRMTLNGHCQNARAGDDNFARTEKREGKKVAEETRRAQGGEAQFKG